MPPIIDPRLLATIAQLKGHRARVFVEYVMVHGHITTEDLKRLGYHHPPRAARDVREAGIPLETFKVKDVEGRTIGAYRFGDPGQIEGDKLKGRSVLSKKLKEQLLARDSAQCAICAHRYDSKFLQIDHRIPYEVSGEVVDEGRIDAFHLLCASCQRRKSFTCEHCPNWAAKSISVCLGCAWACPTSYTHIATQEIRRVELVFVGEEIALHEALRYNAIQTQRTEQDEIKALLRAMVSAGPSASAAGQPTPVEPVPGSRRATRR